MKVGIVGGGPAGTSTAISLLLNSKDVEVDIYERLSLPRGYCAGGIGFAMLKVLNNYPIIPELIEKAKETDVNEFRLSISSKYGIVKEAKVKSSELNLDRLGIVIDRKFFDALMLKRARKLGAKVIHEPALPEKGKITSLKTGEANDYDYVVDARGFNAFDYNVYGAEAEFVWQGYVYFLTWENMWIDIPIDLINTGYVWIFPGRMRFKIGFGEKLDIYKRKGRKLIKKVLNRYLHIDKVDTEISAILPLSGKYTLYEGGVFKVGTAAGLINPLHGGGIAYAIISGYALGKAIVKAGKHVKLAKYIYSMDRRLNRVKAEIILSKKLKDKIYTTSDKERLLRHLITKLEYMKFSYRSMSTLNMLKAVLSILNA